MKNFYLLLLVMASFSCTTFNDSKNQKEQLANAYISNANNSEESSEKIIVFTMDDNVIFELGEIIDILSYETDNEVVEIVVFETSTQDDFVKIHATSSISGISAEYAWIRYKYPGFSRVRQSLIDIKINGRIFKCDLLLIKNDTTGELKSIYFEISDFFGKWG